MRFNSPGHAAVRLAAMLVLALAAGCASQPRDDRPVDLERREQVKFHSGRVSLTITDYGGRPLNKARVDLEGANDHTDYFRTAAFSDVFGRVSFSGVPERVRISVYHSETQANYSEVVNVPPLGITELRVMVRTYEE